MYPALDYIPKYIYTNTNYINDLIIAVTTIYIKINISSNIKHSSHTIINSY